MPKIEQDKEGVIVVQNSKDYDTEVMAGQVYDGVQVLGL